MSTVAMAERYSSLAFDELPPGVVARGKDFVLDTIGVAVGGVGLPSSSLLAAWVVDAGGRPESSVIGGGRVPASQAALANATIAHGLELDDVDNASSLHPGVVVIPTALAVSELTGSSGEEFLTAVVAGYDAIVRIGRAAGPAELYARGFHPTAICGAFAAAVTAGRILRLDRDQMANAMGIAGSFAAGNLEYMANGAWTKRLQVGGAAHAGVMSAELAARGFTGPVTILEGMSGFLAAHSAAPNPARLTEGLDEPYSILDVSVKPFACCRYCQTPIDAVLELVDEHDIDADQVENVDIDMVSAGIQIVAEPRDRKIDPKNTVDAQFSVYFSVAVAMRRHAAFVAEFGDEAVGDPEVRRLMAMIRVHADEGLDEFYPERWPSRVTITMRSGERFQLLAKSCRGDPDKPLSSAQLQEKFDALASDALSPEGSKTASGIIQNLEQESGVDALVGILGSAGGTG